MIASAKLPVCSPKLPLAETILAYLKQMDANRWYTNFGPLYTEFHSRLADLFKVRHSELTLAASGTTILELCLKAMKIPAGSLCIMPAWTFVATPLAAESAGLTSYFVDVDIDTQTINPETFIHELQAISTFGNIGAVIITSPFGCPVDSKKWDNFSAATGIPVIIDAAASFDTILQSPIMPVSKTPMMVSLHATKVFGMGEGGLLLSTNEELINRVETLTRFGFEKGGRDARDLGTNAKMSEYAAAVGLAALDEWSRTRAAWQQVTHAYQAGLEKLSIQHMLSSQWVSSTCNIICPQKANELQKILDTKGIHARKWWGDGCHLQPVFKQRTPNLALENTEILQKSILGLPFYVDMQNEEIERVMSELLVAFE